MTKEASISNDESELDLAEAAFWGFDSTPMTMREEAPPKPDYDLEDRTTSFGEAIIRFAKKIPQNPVNNRLIDQLVGAGNLIFCKIWRTS
ncbi:MAG: hypothetical protein ABSH48_16705 [Verrucomicrobiota bacterium]|jgi:hypothetical protein